MTVPVDTDRVRAVVSACPGVVSVHGRGPNGVAADATGVEVHVVARYGVSLPELGERLDREIGPLLGGRTLTVVVDDVRTDDEPDDDEPTGGPVAALPPADADAVDRPALPAGVTGGALALPPGDASR